jgi:hypothetical protein
MLGVLLFEPLLNLSLPALGKTGADVSGQRNKLLDPSLAKASASSLSWIFLWPGTQGGVTNFRMGRAYIASRHSTPTSTRTLSLVPQGVAKLLGYLGKYTFSPLCSSFLYSPSHRIQLRRFPSCSCSSSEKDSLLLGLTPIHLLLTRQPSWTRLCTILVPPNWRVMGRVDSHRSRNGISPLKGVSKAITGIILSFRVWKQGPIQLAGRGSWHALHPVAYPGTYRYQ